MSIATPDQYTRTAVLLHWLVFVLIACSFPLAVYMVDLPLSPQKLKYVSWHKWIGVTVFLLALARLAWRMRHAAPSLPSAMTAWQRRAAALTHQLLYVLIVVIPLTGWLYSSATGVPTVYLGLVQLPDLVGRDKPLADLLRVVHTVLNYTMLALIVIHVVAALKHHLIDRDDVLTRMLPVGKPGRKGNDA
jgi:cytochrome b561